MSDRDDLERIRNTLLEAVTNYDTMIGDNPTRIEVRPTSTPARDLPLGLLDDVCRLLQAWGLRVNDAPSGDIPVLMALGRIADEIPAEYGGRAS